MSIVSWELGPRRGLGENQGIHIVRLNFVLMMTDE